MRIRSWLAVGAIVFAAPVSALAQCTTGVALPVRHLAGATEICPSNGDAGTGMRKAESAQAEANRALRAKLERELAAFRMNNVTLGVAKAGLDLAESLPLVKQVTSATVWGGIYKIAKGHAETYFRDRNNAALDQAVRDIFQGYLARNPDQLSRESGPAMQDFVAYLGSRLSWERYGEVGKVLDQHLLREVDSLKGRLETLRQTIRTQTGNGADAGEVTPPAIDIDARIADVRAEFNGALGKTADETAKDIEILYAYQKRALRDHQKLAADVADLRGTVEQHSATIARNTARIETNTAAIADLRAGMLQFSIEQEATAALTADNAVRIDAIGTVLFNGTDPKSQLILLRSNTVRLPRAEKAELENSLAAKIEQQERIETIDKVSRGIEMGQKALEIGVRAGLSPQDAERVAKLLAVAEIGVGVARVYAGDVSGVLGVADGATTLFGGGGGKDPAHEQLMQQFAVINAKLDALSDQVETVSKQLDALADWSVKVHEQSMRQFSVLEGLGESANLKLDYLVKLAQSSSTPQCRVLGGRYSDEYLEKVAAAGNVPAIRRLTQLNTAAPDTKACLLSFENAPTPLDSGYVHYGKVDPLTEGYGRLVGKAYAIGPAPAIERIPGCRQAVLLEPAALLLLARARVQLDPVLYLTTSEGIQPVGFFTTEDHAQRHQDAVQSLTRWEDMVDCAIAQQSVVAGGAVYAEPILNVLQNVLAGPSSTWVEQQHFARDVIRSNFPYVQLNLATRLLYTEFKDNAAALSLLGTIEDGCATPTPDVSADLATLNGMIRNQRFKLVPVSKPLGQGCTVALQLTGPPLGADDGPFDAMLNVAPAEIVAANRILYPDDVDGLIAVKAKLARLRATYELSESLTNDPDVEAFLARTNNS